MLTPNSSIAANVMRSGMWQPLSPVDARRDLDTQRVLDMTAEAVDHTPMSVLPVARPSTTTVAVAQTVTAMPPTPIQTPPSTPPTGSHSRRHHWFQQQHREHPAIKDIKRLHPHALLHGSDAVELGDWNGRPVAKFSIAASPPAGSAQNAAQSMRNAARLLQSNGFIQLPPELVGGPLAALLRGGAVELHFQNGVVIRTAL